MLESLNALPAYERFVPDAIEAKQAKVYHLWTRSTISWKLECEGEVPPSWNPPPGESRSQALARIKAALGPEARNNYAGVAVGLVVALIFLTAICTIASVGVSRERSVRPAMSQFCCMVLSQIVLVSFILDYSIKNYRNMDSRLKLLIDAGIVNQCGDEYSQVPYEAASLKADFLTAEKEQKQVGVLTFVTLGMLAVIIAMVCGCVGCWSYQNHQKEKHDADVLESKINFHSRSSAASLNRD